MLFCCQVPLSVFLFQPSFRNMIVPENAGFHGYDTGFNKCSSLASEPVLM